ncbi:hypothetical protein D3C81_498940 [compost metagenome]
MQQVARFLVDLVDRVFQRVDRFRQVRILGVEEIFALGSLRQLVERGQVDGAQPRDGIRQARHFALQIRGAHVRVQFFRQRGLVGARLQQLLGELLLVQARGLLLELHFHDLVTLRLQAAFRLRTRIFGQTQLLRNLIEFMARVRQRPFLRGAALEQILQAVGGSAAFQVGQFQLSRLQALRHLLRLRAGRGDVAAQFLDLRAVGFFRVFRILGGAFQVAQSFARLGQTLFLLQEIRMAVFVRFLQVAQLHVQLFEFFFRFRLDLLLFRFLRGDFRQVGTDLRAALIETRFHFRQFHHVQLQGMHGGRQLLYAQAQIGQVARQGAHCRVGPHGTGARLFGQQLLGTQLLADIVDFLLAAQHAFLLRIGRIKAHAGGRDHVAGARDEIAARRQFAPFRQGFGRVFHGVGIVQPVLQQATQARVVEFQQIQKRFQARHFRHGQRRHGRWRVQGQLGRWRIGKEGLGPVDIRQLQGRRAFAQDRLHGRFPARLDLQLLPQSRQGVELVLFQPWLDLALGLHPLLQLFQSGKTRFQLGVGGRFGVDLRLCFGPFLLQLGLLLQRFFQVEALLFQRLLLFFQLQFQVFQVAAVGQTQAVLFLLQALAARQQAGQNVRGIALVRRFQLQLLLRLHDPRARFRALVLRGAPGGVQLGQLLALLLGHHLRLLDLGGQLLEVEFRLFDLLLVVATLLRPLVALGRQGRQLRLQAGTRFDDELDLRFQAADFSIRLVQMALRRMQAVPHGKVRLAHLLEGQLDIAQLGRLLFQVCLRLFHFAEIARLLVLRLVLAQQPQQLLLFFLVRLQGVEARGHGRLRFEFFQVGIEFAQDVFHAQQILARVLQTVFRLAAAFLVFRYARRFFQEHAQFFRARFDDARNHALADDGVGARAEAGAEENILDVAPAHRLAIDVIGGGAVARQGALDGDLGVLAPLAGRLAIVIVEHQFHGSAAGRLAVRGAVENDVLHRFTAQLRRFRFAQHPAHGVDDVRFAAAIRANHAHELAWHLEIGGIDERLKSRQLDGRETHVF